MKKFKLLPRPFSLLSLCFALMFMASCSKKTALITTKQELAYQQNLPSQNIESTVNTTVTTDENTTVAVNKEEENNAAENNAVVKTNSKKAGKMVARINKIKEQGPEKVILLADNFSKNTKLSSATQSVNEQQIEINGKLKIGIILLLVGALFYFIPGLGFIGWILQIIGVIFLILWLLEYL